MSVDEVRFPYKKHSYGAMGGPKFNTNVVTLYSGHESRNSNWFNARAEYSIPMNSLEVDEYQELLQFFRCRKGMLYGFRFKDWLDYTIVNEGIGFGDDVKVDFQITKTYINGGRSYVRTITKIVDDADAIEMGLHDRVIPHLFEVKVNAVVLVENTDYTVDRTTGIITFTAAPPLGHPISVTCEFDVPVRLNNDQLSVSIDNYNTNSTTIDLIELRI